MAVLHPQHPRLSARLLQITRSIYVYMYISLLQAAYVTD